MALHPSDEQRQGQTVESGAGCPAEEIAGAVYLRLETGAGVTGVSTGRRSVNQRRAIRYVLCEGGKLTREGRAFLQENQLDRSIFGHAYQP